MDTSRPGLPEGHVCTCTNCTSHLIMTGPRINQHHYSVRFKHQNHTTHDGDTTYIPIFQRRHQLGAIEDYCHPTDGWVLRWTTDPPHICQTCPGEEAEACIELVFGDFMMVILQPNPPRIVVDGGPPEAVVPQGIVALHLDGFPFQIMPDYPMELPTAGQRSSYKLRVLGEEQQNLLLRHYGTGDLIPFLLQAGAVRIEGRCHVMEVKSVLPTPAAQRLAPSVVNLLIIGSPSVKVL